VRLLTFNIRLGVESSLQALAAAIVATGADLVGLQELGRRWVMGPPGDQLATLARLTGLPHTAWGEALRLLPPPALATPEATGLPAASLGFLTREGPRVRAASPEGSGFGVGLLSRWPLVGAPRITRLRREDDEQRVLLAADVEAPGGVLAVAVTHLSVCSRDRALQARQLAAQVAHGTAPFALLGDLNDKPDSEVLGTLKGAGLIDGAASCPEPVVAATFPARAPRHRLDYVLVSEHLTPLRACVPASVASDHRPLWVELSCRLWR